MPVMTRMTTAQAVAERKRRSARELARILNHAFFLRMNLPENRSHFSGSCAGWREQITEAAHGLDDFDPEFLADAADEHFDGVAIAIEVLIVKMLDQLGARDHAPGVMHQIG